MMMMMINIMRFISGWGYVVYREVPLQVNSQFSRKLVKVFKNPKIFIKKVKIMLKMNVIQKCVKLTQFLKVDPMGTIKNK